MASPSISLSSPIPFKKRFSLEHRKKESERIREKYKDKIPVILQRANDKIVSIDKQKYLIPKDLTIGQFAYTVRRRTTLLPEQALFFFVNNTMLPISDLISKVYEDHHDEDGFLYIFYAGENTYGN